MIILHFTEKREGAGYGSMQGVHEYIVLFEEEDDLKGDHDTMEEAIEAQTAPGFKLYRKYDTEIDTDFSGLPLDRNLIPQRI